MEWQPIETAPWHEDILVGRWDEGVWRCAVYEIENEFWQETWEYDAPTHWMPLPEPPDVVADLLDFAREVAEHFERSGIIGPLTMRARQLLKRAGRSD